MKRRIPGSRIRCERRPEFRPTSRASGSGPVCGLCAGGSVPCSRGHSLPPGGFCLRVRQQEGSGDVIAAEQMRPVVEAERAIEVRYIPGRDSGPH